MELSGQYCSQATNDMQPSGGDMSTNGETNGRLAEETAELESQINDILSNIKMFLAEIDEEKAVLEKYRKKIRKVADHVKEEHGASVAGRVDWSQNSLNIEAYREGADDPILHKRIKTLVALNDEFVIFIDDRDELQWFRAKRFETNLGNDLSAFKSKYDDVVGDIAEIEVFSKRALRQHELRDFKFQLGSALAAFLYAWKDETGIRLIHESKKYLLRKVNERFRSSVLTMVFNCFLPAVALIIGLSLSNAFVLLLQPDWWTALFLFPFGMIGACISIVQRQKNVLPDPELWRGVLWKEISAKALAGGFSASVVCVVLRIVAEYVTMPELDPPLIISALMVLGIIAGWSERWLQVFLEKGEHTLILKTEEYLSVKLK